MEADAILFFGVVLPEEVRHRIKVWLREEDGRAIDDWIEAHSKGQHLGVDLVRFGWCEAPEYAICVGDKQAYLTAHYGTAQCIDPGEMASVSRDWAPILHRACAVLGVPATRVGWHFAASVE